jgi:hypothetical protein
LYGTSHRQRGRSLQQKVRPGAENEMAEDIFRISQYGRVDAVDREKLYLII